MTIIGEGRKIITAEILQRNNQQDVTISSSDDIDTLLIEKKKKFTHNLHIL